MTKLGCLVFTFSIVFLIVSLTLPQLFAPIAPLFCAPGEQLASQKVGYSTPTESGYQVQFTCVSQDGKPRNVSTEVTLAMMGVWLVLFLGGMILAGIGSSRSRKNGFAQQTLTQQPTPITPDGYTVTAPSTVPNTTDSKRSLADTLHQLDDAHKQGLINDDEYERFRHDALNKLV